MFFWVNPEHYSFSPGYCMMSFLSIIRVQETSDLNNSRVVQLIHLGFVSIPIAQTHSPTSLWSHSQITGRKGGFSLPAHLFVGLSFIFWEASHRTSSRPAMGILPDLNNFTGPAPDDMHEISAWLWFWLLCWPSAVMDCFLKIFCVFCQVPWVVAQSDRNHIHVFVSAAWTIFYSLLSVWMHLVVPLCLPVWCITFQRLFFEAL